MTRRYTNPRLPLSCVYTMQPVVQPAASCKHSCSQLYNRLYNHLSKSFWIFIICVRPRYIIRLQPPFWHVDDVVTFAAAAAVIVIIRRRRRRRLQHFPGCTTGCTAGCTTGCIVYTGFYFTLRDHQQKASVSVYTQLSVVSNRQYVTRNWLLGKSKANRKIY